jgi:hypothetical protein
MENAVATYFAAWNETDSDQRRLLLERSVTQDAELVDPTGRSQGIDGLSERIGRYQSAAPRQRSRPPAASMRTTTSCGTPGSSILKGRTSWKVSTSPSAPTTDGSSESSCSTGRCRPPVRNRQTGGSGSAVRDQHGLRSDIARRDGKEGVDGSSPSKGFRNFLLIGSCRCHGGDGDESRRPPGGPRRSVLFLCEHQA